MKRSRRRARKPNPRTEPAPLDEPKAEQRSTRTEPSEPPSLQTPPAPETTLAQAAAALPAAAPAAAPAVTPAPASASPARPTPPGSPLPHLPWLLGLLLAPLLFGTLHQASKVIVGAMFVLSLFLLTTRIGGNGSRRALCPWPWVCLAMLGLLLPLIPLPIEFTEALSPQRVALQNQFPLNSDSAPALLPLTLSTTGTIQRIADLALVVAAFWLARRAASNARFPQWFIATLTCSIGLLAVSDVWLRLDGQERLLGLLPDRAGHAAGTFPNRNHFASYIFMASLAIAGWLLRQHWPLRSSRGCSKHPPSFVASSLIALTALFALIMATRTGSRAGLAAFFIGALAWWALLAVRSPSRHRQLRTLSVFLLLLFLVAACSDLVLSRLARFGDDLAFKSALWQDALGLSARFPALGTGAGTFHVAFNHFKTFAGDRTFLHAENEWIQLLVEHGFFGAALLLIPLSFFIAAAWSFVRREFPLEPELSFGCAAALGCFAVHSLFEFVGQIPANAILAAALGGFLIGSRDEASRPVVVPAAGFGRIGLHLAGTLLLLALVTAQGLAAFHAYNAAKAPASTARLAHLRTSLRFWPWDSERAISLTRQEVQALPRLARAPADFYRIDGTRIRGQLDRSVALDPFNWELRLERTWLDLSFGANPLQALEQARQCARLNPLQPRIPLGFARHFLEENPALALEFIEAAPLRGKEDFHEALELAWQLKPDPAALWTIINDTPAGLQALAEFALQRSLPEIADQAHARLRASNR